MKTFLVSIGLLVLVGGAAFSQSSGTPNTTDPFKPGYINKSHGGNGCDLM
jgi:hypothetical protein